MEHSNKKITEIYNLIREKLDKKIKISPINHIYNNDFTFDILKSNMVIGNVYINVNMSDSYVTVSHMEQDFLHDSIDVYEIIDNYTPFIDATILLIEDNYDRLVDIHSAFKKIKSYLCKIEQIIEEHSLDGCVEYLNNTDDFDV